jgi:GNAT superfamily N-acetyltransferase
MQDIVIERALVSDAEDIAVMVGALLQEIMETVGVQAFHFDQMETVSRLQDFLHREKYIVFVARNESRKAIGFIGLCESYALYTEGCFGTIPELYVSPTYRSHHLGATLIAQAKAYGASQGWRRLEVTTPALPEFNKTLAFYQREGFEISGGRKLKVLI